MEQLSELRHEMEKCFRCSLCKMVPLPVVKHPDYTDACPACRHYGFHGYSSGGKQIMALSLLDGRVRADANMARIAFACTPCGYGDVACKFIMASERHRVNVALKNHLVEAGLGLPEHQETAHCLEASGLPLRNPPLAPGDWAADLGLSVFPDARSDCLLFAGCGACGDPASADVVRKLARLLRHAGIDFGILGAAERSCGLPAYWTGHGRLFGEIAASTTRQIESHNVQTVIAAGGSCFGALHAKHPEAFRKAGFRVVHATQVLLEALTSGALKLTTPVPLRVTYHDPCYLGRQSEPPVEWTGEEKRTLNCMTYSNPQKPIRYGTTGVYDAPREILARVPGLQFVEMHRIREYSFCCGGGGGAPEAYPALAHSAAAHRLDEARNVGAEAIVTACHHCETHLAKSQSEGSNNGKGLPVFDISDILYQAAGLEE